MKPRSKKTFLATETAKNTNVLLFFLWTLLLAFFSNANISTATETFAEEIDIFDDSDDSSTDSFAESLAKLELPDEVALEEVVLGQKDAPVTLIMYTSFTCSYCKTFHLQELPKFKERYVDTGKVKIYLRCYLDDLGALESATLTRCLCKQSIDKIISVYHAIFSQQSEWMKSDDPRKFLKNIFISQKFNPSDIDDCIEKRSVQAGLMKEQQRAMNEFELSSMPAFIVNGKTHQGIITSEELADMCGVK
jgi:protein-disulfide isomerase